MGSIIWLASYPKSGNTWLRIFFTNLMRDGAEPADINGLSGGPIASDRWVFDDLTGLEASDLTPEEIDRLRPDVYKRLADQTDSDLLLKVHDAYTYGYDGRALLSAAGSRAIYLIRNPLDVAVSFANHSSTEIDTVIDHMAETDFTLSSSNRRLHSQLRQRLMSWSAHVMSWVEAPIPVRVIRYEDMKQRPLETFTVAAEFAGVPHSPASIGRAVALSDFKELKRQEQEHGFKERPPKTTSFFREGNYGSWRRYLTVDQAARLIERHREVMLRFGYLNTNGEPVF